MQKMRPNFMQIFKETKIHNRVTITEDTYHAVNLESGEFDQFRGDANGILPEREKTENKTTYYLIELIYHLHK